MLEVNEKLKQFNILSLIWFNWLKHNNWASIIESILLPDKLSFHSLLKYFCSYGKNCLSCFHHINQKFKLFFNPERKNIFDREILFLWRRINQSSLPVFISTELINVWCMDDFCSVCEHLHTYIQYIFIKIKN